jgi:hypothetical protein
MDIGKLVYSPCCGNDSPDSLCCLHHCSYCVLCHPASSVNLGLNGSAYGYCSIMQSLWLITSPSRWIYRIVHSLGVGNGSCHPGGAGRLLSNFIWFYCSRHSLIYSCLLVSGSPTSARYGVSCDQNCTSCGFLQCWPWSVSYNNLSPTIPLIASSADWRKVSVSVPGLNNISMWQQGLLYTELQWHLYAAISSDI